MVVQRNCPKSTTMNIKNSSSFHLNVNFFLPPTHSLFLVFGQRKLNLIHIWCLRNLVKTCDFIEEEEQVAKKNAKNLTQLLSTLTSEKTRPLSETN
jgi:hypothetical protein